jgi:hypothetical protein
MLEGLVDAADADVTGVRRLVTCATAGDYRQFAVLGARQATADDHILTIEQSDPQSRDSAALTDPCICIIVKCNCMKLRGWPWRRR